MSKKQRDLLQNVYCFKELMIKEYIYKIISLCVCVIKDHILMDIIYIYQDIHTSSM